MRPWLNKTRRVLRMPGRPYVIEAEEEENFDFATAGTLLADYDVASATVDGSSHVTALANATGGDTNKNLTKAGSGDITYDATDSEFNDQPTMAFAAGPRLQGAAAWASPPSQPITLYFVGKCTSGIIYSGISARSDFQIATGPHYRLYAGSFATDVGSANPGSPHINAIIFNAASSAVYHNDPVTAAWTGMNPGTGANDGTVIGDVGGGGGPGTFTMARLLIYSGAHNEASRTAIMDALADLYGL